MRNMWRIVGVTLRALYLSGRSRKKGKLSGTGYLFLLGFAGLVFMLYSAVMSVGMAVALKPIGALPTLVSMLYLICFAITLFTGIYQIGGLLFTGKDVEQLLALPLHKWQIIASKLAALLIEDWITCLIVLAPGLTVYYVFAHPGFLFWIFSLIGIAFAPVLALALAVAFAYLISLLSVGTRFKTLFNIVFTMAFVVAMVILPQMLARNFGTIILTAVEPIGAVARYIPTVMLITDATAGFNLMALGGYVALNVIPFALLVYLLSKGFHRIWARNQVGEKRKQGKLLYGGGSQAAALFRKEAGRYFSSYPYVLNTAVGMILMTVFSVAALFRGSSVLEVINIPGVENMILPAIVLVFCFMSGMSATTPASISIERHTLWVLKACPVDYRHWLRAKFIFSMTIIAPLLLLNSALMMLAFRFSLAQGLYLFALPLLLGVAMSYIGLVANLKMPRQDLKNDMQIVKQSPSVMVAVFGNMGLLAVIVVAYAFLSQFLSFFAFGSIAALLLIVVSLLLRRYIYTKGISLLRNID